MTTHDTSKAGFWLLPNEEYRAAMSALDREHAEHWTKHGQTAYTGRRKQSDIDRDEALRAQGFTGLPFSDPNIGMTTTQMQARVLAMHPEIEEKKREQFEAFKDKKAKDRLAAMVTTTSTTDSVPGFDPDLFNLDKPIRVQED